MAKLIKFPKKEGKYLVHCSDGKAYEATKVNKYMPQGIMFFAIPADVQILGYTHIEAKKKQNTSVKSSSTKKKKP